MTFSTSRLGRATRAAGVLPGQQREHRPAAPRASRVYCSIFYVIVYHIRRLYYTIRLLQYHIIYDYVFIQSVLTYYYSYYMYYYQVPFAAVTGPVAGRRGGLCLHQDSPVQSAGMILNSLFPGSLFS